MNTLEALKAAVRDRVPVTFNYLREGKDPGARKGNTHAVYIQRLKSGEERVYADIVQTEGVTDSGEALPSWRKFFPNEIQNVELHRDEAPFEIHEGYNATSYDFPIAKV